jgi:hypothetical protein
VKIREHEVPERKLVDGPLNHTRGRPEIVEVERHRGLSKQQTRTREVADEHDHRATEEAAADSPGQMMAEEERGHRQ